MPVIYLSAKGLAEMIREGKKFEEVYLPRLFKTTPERLQAAQGGMEGMEGIFCLDAHTNYHRVFMFIYRCRLQQREFYDDVNVNFDNTKNKMFIINVVPEETSPDGE